MLGWPSNGERPRQAGHTPYCFPQLVGNRSALRGAGTTLHRLGGAWTICSNVRVTLSGLRFTSSTASTAPSLITRYHAPRRNLTLTSVCSLAHCWCGIGASLVSALKLGGPSLRVKRRRNRPSSAR